MVVGEMNDIENMVIGDKNKDKIKNMEERVKTKTFYKLKTNFQQKQDEKTDTTNNGKNCKKNEQMNKKLNKWLLQEKQK